MTPRIRSALVRTSIVMVLLGAGLGAISDQAGAIAPTTVYAYAHGTATGTSCAKDLTGDPSVECSLSVALATLTAGGTVFLETPDTEAPYVGPFTVPNTGGAMVTITPDAGVDIPVLNGRNVHSHPLVTLADGANVTMSNFMIAASEYTSGAGAGVFVGNGASLTADGMTFKGNHGYLGGAIIVGSGNGQTGTLVVSNSWFTGNTAAMNGAAIDAADYGGTAYVDISNSTFYLNTGPYDGGAIAMGTNGGSGTLRIWSSTFTQNVVSQNGSAISVGAYSGSGTVTALVLNSTFADNGWHGISVAGGSTLGLVGTVVTGSKAGLCEQPVTDLGWNLEYGTGAAATPSCGFTNGVNGDIVGVDPQLGPFGDNGGPTYTFLPSATSPLLNAIPFDTTLTNGGHRYQICHTVDQRGAATVMGQACAIGSVQPVPLQPIQVTASQNADQSVTVEWTPGTGPSGLPSSWLVTASPGGATCSSTSTSCIVKGLDVGTTYTFVVSASNPSGTSIPSLPSNAVTIVGLAATGFSWVEVVVLAVGMLTVGHVIRRRRPRGASF